MSAHDPQSPPADLTTLMFESTTDAVFAVDLERRIIAFNRSAERSLGVDRSRALGRPCRDVLGADLCGDCALDAVLRTGRPIVDRAVDLRDAAGRPVPATLSCGVLRDTGGRAIGGIITFRNLNWVRRARKDADAGGFAEIVTDDLRTRRVFDILPTLAESESSVLICGETGTGKTLVARLLHDLSARREGPFVTVNCGALPETLLESELFGYRAGAFTGAVGSRAGRIAASEGGTLFLDEISDIPLSAQVKLLRFLQDRVYERLGDVKPIRADVRVVTATNRDLVRLVEENRFRRDLYYRVNVLTLDLPPLRERRDDVAPLARRFLERLSVKRRKHVAGFSPAVRRLLAAYDYPGNVRELENIVEHAFVLCDGPIIEVEHIPEGVRTADAVRRGGSGTGFADLEARFLLEALARHDGHRGATADELGIHRSTLLRRLRRLGLDPPARDGRATRRARRDPGGSD